jgi:hypothetical protein
MAKMKTTAEMQAQLKSRREAWIARVTSLANQVSEWSVAEGWKVERHEKEITEEFLGTYRVPEVVVRLDIGELIIAPVALHIAGGNGRVDLEAVPTLARVKMVGAGIGWKLFADPNVPLRVDWNRENFVQLARDLLS